MAGVLVYPAQRASSQERPVSALLLLTLAMACSLLGSPYAQAQSEQGDQRSLLPTTTGDPLTIKPIDLPDVSCTVMGWDRSNSKPVLSLLCPPKAVFAPLRVFVKLSWMQPGDVPGDCQDILAPANSGTKIHTTKASAWVWLQVRKSDQAAHYQWVPFNGVVDVALIVESRNKKIP